MKNFEAQIQSDNPAQNKSAFKTPRLFAVLVCFVMFFAPKSYAQFRADIAPFDVINAAGERYLQPFLGGFNVPRPQLVDIDADGDPDLFVQEKSGEIIFFKNRLGEPGRPAASFSFSLESTHFQALDVGEWYRFADMDQDGDFDLLAEQPFSFIRYYQNIGTPRVPAFVQAADTLRDALGVPVFSNRQSIPNVADIDCNGKQDFFIGQQDGTISRYEVIDFDENGAPVFAFLGDRFQGIEIIGSVGKNRDNNALHGANTLFFHDLDADGDPDLLWGDFFEEGLLLLENTGTCEVPDFTTPPVSYPIANPIATSGYNAPTIGDINMDGKADLLVGVLGGAFFSLGNDADNLIYLERQDDGLVKKTGRFLSNIDVGSDAVPVLHDLDGDEDLDLVLTNSIDAADPEMGRAEWYENEGAADQPSFRYKGVLPLEPAFNYAPAFGDLDADGDADMLVGAWQGGVVMYRNAGGVANYERVDDVLLTLPSGGNTTPTLGDLDGDGDLDVLVGEATGTLNLFRNIGSRTEPAFVLETEAFGAIDVGRRSAPLLYDLDGDLDLDLIIGSDQDGIQTYLNVGGVEMPRFEATEFFNLPVVRRMSPSMGDVNGDGQADLFVGTLEGGVLYFEREGVDTTVDVYLRPTTDNAISLYPNPAKNLTTLVVRAFGNRYIKVVLFDLLGRPIITLFKGVQTEDAFSMDLDLAPYPAGTYLIRAELRSGETVTRMLQHVR